MTFVFPILLGGLALVGIPVLLHLIFRQKPKRLQFPAFRFLVKRHRTNLRKLQLRHLVLLALRVLLIAAICLALARPKLFYAEISIRGDRPVAAVFIIDTSYSMEYKTSDKLTRLDEAKHRATQLLDELPEGSRVAIIDSAETVASRGAWLTSMSQARQRIGNLNLQYANAPLNRSVLAAYRMFAEMLRGAEDEGARQLPRFVFLFSDRMRACWDAGQQQLMLDAQDQVPPPLENLQELRGDVAGLVAELNELRKKLPPPAGRDHPEQSLIAALEKLQSHIPELRRDDLAADQELAREIPIIRRGCRELLATLPQIDSKQANLAKDYRDRLVAGLEKLAQQVQGAYGIFVDVGVENAVDLALWDLQLPRGANGQERQVFNEDEKIILRVPVQAFGKDFDNEVIFQSGGNSFKHAMTVKAGERSTALFELDFAKLRLKPGMHQFEVRLNATDLLPFDNTRYLTIAIREPQRVLVLTDDVAKAKFFQKALEALRYKPDVKQVQEIAKIGPQELLHYDAIYLFNVADPDASAWSALENYVARGGGLGVVPAGIELKPAAYNSEPAQKLLPGTFKQVVTATESKGVKTGYSWDLAKESIYQHSMLRPFRDWRFNRKIDFIDKPPVAWNYWEIQPNDKGTALVDYADKKHPALLDRRLDEGKGGRVLLFTTTMDARTPEWNNYLESLTSIYVVLTGLATRYLAGELEEANLNFQCGRDVPTVKLPLSARFPDYIVRGPVFERTAGTEGTLRLEKADKPGNYVVEGVKTAADNGKQVARFSVNIPAGEADLTRVPVAEIENVLGPKSVTTVERRANIREVMGKHFSEPVELFPFLMVLLLVVLALENLLANKFYRKESTPEAS